MQLPLMHSLPAVQARLFGFSAQLRLGGEPWQVYGDRHCTSIEHVVRHVSPPQVYGEQLKGTAVMHPPVPLQRDSGVEVDPVHDCAPHAGSR